MQNHLRPGSDFDHLRLVETLGRGDVRVQTHVLAEVSLTWGGAVVPQLVTALELSVVHFRDGGRGVVEGSVEFTGCLFSSRFEHFRSNSLSLSAGQSP